MTWRPLIDLMMQMWAISATDRSDDRMFGEAGGPLRLSVVDVWLHLGVRWRSWRHRARRRRQQWRHGVYVGYHGNRLRRRIRGVLRVISIVVRLGPRVVGQVRQRSRPVIIASPNSMIERIARQNRNRNLCMGGFGFWCLLYDPAYTRRRFFRYRVGCNWQISCVIDGSSLWNRYILRDLQ